MSLSPGVNATVSSCETIFARRKRCGRSRRFIRFGRRLASRYAACVPCVYCRHMRFHRVAAVLCWVACVATIGIGAAQRTLDIYFIDVEGGQSTLIVTPAGESLLVDTGFAADGTFRSKPGDPRRARDAQRIAAAARDAGVSRIDYLLITHFHADHMGGVVELASLLPIQTFIDHGSVLPVAESVKGTLAAF